MDDEDIIGGKNTTISQVPYQVALFLTGKYRTLVFDHKKSQKFCYPCDKK
jgi:hypothetical protein